MRTCVCVVAGWCVLLHCAASAVLGAGSRVISGNPYDLTAIKNYAKIHANSYHIKKTGSPTLTEALAEPTYGKPIIISTDGTSAGASDVQAWAPIIANAGQHLEHYDQPIHDIAGSPDYHQLENYATWPASAKGAMTYMAPYASDLTPGGTLTMASGKFHWNGAPVTLMGISMVGALIIRDLDYNKYLDVLAQGGVNLTRVWVIEQWTALGATVNFPNGYDIGIYPFTGTYWNHDYNLYQLNDAFFTHMKAFVQAAAARGIVVQLSLTDRCGLEAQYLLGGFGGSPYNAANNQHSFLTDPAGFALPPFLGTDGTPVGTVNRALFERITRELRDEGNVIYEIMNEPYYKNGRWASADVVTFHQWTADVVDAAFSLPADSVSIDLGTTNVESGVALITVSDGDTVPADISGKNCRTNAVPGADNYMYFSVSDTYAFQANKPEQYITIHYHDAGTGSLMLQYDSSTGDDVAAKYKDGGSVALTGRNVWRQKTFHVTDACFGNRQNGGADFRIHHPLGQAFWLDVVQVRLNPPTPTKPVAVIEAAPTGGKLPLVVSFDGAGSYDADGGNIVGYDWDFGDGSPHADTVGASHTYMDDGTFSASLTVTDDDGLTHTASVAIAVIRQPGDFDYDGDVDQADFGIFQCCLPEANTYMRPGCEAADLDHNSAVDQGDVAVFLSCLGGSNNPPGC